MKIQLLILKSPQFTAIKNLESEVGFLRFNIFKHNKIIIENLFLRYDELND